MNKKLAEADSGAMVSLLLISLFNSAGVFFVIPITTIHAYGALSLSLEQVGWISVIWPLTVLCLSSPLGALGDRLGAAAITRTSLALNVVAYALIAVFQNVWIFALALFMFGCGKASINGAVRSMMTRLCAVDQREYFFRIRHLMINGGGAIASVAGAYCYHRFGMQAFFFASALFLIALIIGLVGLRNEIVHATDSSRKSSLLNAYPVLSDGRLLAWTASFALVLAVFGAYEAFVPIVAADKKSVWPQAGLLISLNALTVVAFQLVHIKFLRSWSVATNYSWGFFLMFCGFLMLVSPWYSYLFILGGVIVFSIGETMLFPTYDVVLDLLAPEEKKTLYFGAGEAKQIGFMVGPVAGGFLYAQLGSAAMFVACAVWILMSGAIFHRLAKPLLIARRASSTSA
jgi:MFS family permease